MGRPRKTPPLTDQIKRLDDEIPALEVAIGLQEQRQRQAEAALSEPMGELVSAVLDLSAAQQEHALDEVRGVLAQLAPPFARLIAGDRVRTAIIGERFMMPREAKPPFGGQRAVKSMLDGIPSTMKPSELSERLLTECAEASASEMISLIRGENRAATFDRRPHDLSKQPWRGHGIYGPLFRGG